MGRRINDTIAQIDPPDGAATKAARELQRQLTKPAGALGRLEDLHAWAAGIYGEAAPAPPHKTIVVAAADHGVAASGVSAYPQDVTAQMVRNFLAGGAAVNVLATQAGVAVRIVDAGIAREIRDDHLHVAKARTGTDDMARGYAMPREDAELLLLRGIEFSQRIVEARSGHHAIGLGDMGIGNTTAAAAITSVLTGAPPRATAGRGTGIDDATFASKVDAIERALAINMPDPSDPLGVLALVGGCEIAFLAGVTIGAASCRAAVLVDGYPTTAAAMIAAALAPGSAAFMLASHLSAEPGHHLALAHLRLRPLLEFDMRLGEGTGAALAMTMLDAALRIPREMATFDSASVSRSAAETRPEA